MTESPPPKSEAEVSGLVGGERLAAARRANDISARDIAKELHLDEPKVRAMEQNNFDMLGAPVFAKGHLRKYAELVGVPYEDILADYYQLNRSTEAPPVVGPVRKIDRDISIGPWIVGGIVVIIIASAAYWWFTRDPAAPLAQIEPATLAPFATDESGEAGPEEIADSAAITSAAAALVAAEQAPQTEMVAVSLPPVAVGEPEPMVGEVSLLPQVHVELAFSGDCWAEVSDASGRQLFYDLGTAGRIVALSGDEPLRIVLGDSVYVSIAVEGRDYPIPQSARSGRLARLTINSQ